MSPWVRYYFLPLYSVVTVKVYQVVVVRALQARMIMSVDLRPASS